MTFIVPTSPVSFSYPPDVPMYVLYLPRPDFNNSSHTAITRINRESRGLTLDVGIPNPLWPIVDTLHMKYSSLNRGYIDAYLAFMEITLGQELKFIDWEGRTWLGIVLNPQSPASIMGPSCASELNIEFEGELQ